MMKRIISIFLIMLIVFSSLLVFADSTNDTTTEDEITETDEKTDEESEKKLDNVKKSNTQKMIDYEPKASGDDIGLSNGIDRLTDNIREAFEIMKELWQEFSLIITVVVSAFSFIMFFIFKMLNVKAAQQTALIMTIVPICFFLLYNIIPAFLSTAI